MVCEGRGKAKQDLDICTDSDQRSNTAPRESYNLVENLPPPQGDMVSLMSYDGQEDETGVVSGPSLRRRSEGSGE